MRRLSALLLLLMALITGCNAASSLLPTGSDVPTMLFFYVDN